MTKRKEADWPILPCCGCGALFPAAFNAFCCGACKANPKRMAYALSRHRIRMEGQRLARDAERAARSLPERDPLPPVVAERIIESWMR